MITPLSHPLPSYCMNELANKQGLYYYKQPKLTTNLPLSIYQRILYLLYLAHKSSLLRQYALQQDVEDWKPEVVKTFRSIHTGPIALMKVEIDR